MIGEITYNNWMTGAIISIKNKTIFWKYDNIWNTKRSLYGTEENIVKYSGSEMKGQIESGADDVLLILTGLFVTNYYLQMTILALIAVFIPLWMIGLIWKS